ncbi:Single-stranded DNA-binding protein 1 [Vanrija pseudolonga]|uniref:Single-stranded DNA-binding protein 1 n=1 Tax=Vanrija pseudolonga TaxID=143232 RepID=A0AAF0YJC7_9TREE|nr:Single-stranded DNA-binding protein 1 [Vanrija pseudolonga]
MFSALKSVPIKQGVRSFSTTRAVADLSRVTLIGRLGGDPVQRTTQSGKPYYTYTVATRGPGGTVVDEHGNRQEPPTSWHTVFAFGDGAQKTLGRIGKGSTVFVEADLEMRPGGHATDGAALPDRPLLRHQRINVINWIKPENEAAGAEEPETD